MRLQRRGLGLVLVLASAAGAQAKISVTTRLVNVGFTARSVQGTLVTDLRQDELEVLQDGEPEKVAFFSRSQDLPLSLGIVMDVSGSQSNFAQRHADDLEKFLQALLTARDRAFLLCFSDQLRLVGNFSNSAFALVWRLRHYSGRYGYPEVGPKLERDGGTALFDAIYDGADKLANQSGRRALPLFSDGEDNSSATDEGGALAEMQNNDVTVYAIRYSPTHLNARDQYGVRVMDLLASDTGGEAIDAHRFEPKQYLPGIAAALRASYELAYYPAGGSPSAGFHKILIRCRRPGVAIYARSGFREATPPR
ncbi:MAG: VWA domain-containing protein [Terriglobales bacterium]